MAVLFSAVTITSDSDQAEFLVSGIPKSYADLEGWTAFESFMNEVDTEQNIVTADFTNMMASTRAAYIDSSGYTDPTTKNSTDLVMWAEFAHAKGWGYVWGTYHQEIPSRLDRQG